MGMALTYFLEPIFSWRTSGIWSLKKSTNRFKATEIKVRKSRSLLQIHTGKNGTKYRTMASSSGEIPRVALLRVEYESVLCSALDRQVIV